MSHLPSGHISGKYVLATGEAAAHRLDILHQVYGPGTWQILQHAGLKSGMRVADLGCGVGKVTEDLARLVGSEGHVVGVDLSSDQLSHASTVLTEAGHTNVTFVEASATATGLPSDSFDLVYCRFLLLHLVHPHEALQEMYRILRPGGILVCEDGDLTSADSEPPSALRLFAKLFGALGPTRQVDYTLARRLYHLVRDAGFPSPSIHFNQPAITQGYQKRLFDLSISEAGPAIIQAGLLTSEELEEGLTAMIQAAEDDNILGIGVRMSQVFAQKPHREIPV